MITDLAGKRAFVTNSEDDTLGITQYLSPRDTRVVALDKPSDCDAHLWYFRRDATELPATGKMVLINRSWYNRTRVKPVTGFCTKPEHKKFIGCVLPFERLQPALGTQLFIYCLDITKPDQKRRLEDGRVDPLMQWKVSLIDKTALRQRQGYSVARNEMFSRTHSDNLSSQVVWADDRNLTRLNVIRHLMSRVYCPGKNQHLAHSDTEIVCDHADGHVQSGAIAP